MVSPTQHSDRDEADAHGLQKTPAELLTIRIPFLRSGYSRPARQIRWWICGLLFASTVIKLSRSANAFASGAEPQDSLPLEQQRLRQPRHWFPHCLHAGSGVLWTFARSCWNPEGCSITVTFYSVVSMLTPFANSFLSFFGFRFFLGLGESANWPAATKAVSEWFPAKERALATAFFDSGSLGGAVAPFLIFWIYAQWGWKPAFIVPGALGFLWLLLWRRFYHSPEHHPSISTEELAMIQGERLASGAWA